MGSVTDQGREAADEEAVARERRYPACDRHGSQEGRTDDGEGLCDTAPSSPANHDDDGALGLERQPTASIIGAPMTPAPARFDAAASRFSRFFDELHKTFVERTDVLTQVALGLLAREHVLLAGPPGTAKSLVASSVFKRIVCEETGRPSLYARQITESTVQTDLIGPVDFKNLMETGRTTHFTDEGMLGAAHAFLDEVFDGRDMLLRSALNVLQEREVKQGTAITKGRIECALMTSNRYVSDIVDQSRDTLLAFLDRIAFVGFVPRGFADPANLAAVLRQTVGGEGGRALDALLTLQDVDVLQAAVEDVYVAPEICDALAKLLDSLDAEMAAACRADPTFSPTRYISTRTAVRCGRVLRAIAVFDRVFHTPSRALEVLPSDLALLRLHLVLSGPTPAEVEKLLAREVDPAERRQLVILRTEREIFDACYEKLEPIRTSPRPRPLPAPEPKPAETTSFVPAKAAAPSAEEVAAAEDAKIARQIADASAAGDHGTLIAIARTLAERARGGPDDAAAAREKLGRVISNIGSISVRAALGAADPKNDPLASVRALASLARSLEDGTASMHPTASWVEARALALLDDVALHAAGPTQSVLAGGAEAAWTHVEGRLSTLESLAEVRRELSQGSATTGLTPDESVWHRAIAGAEEELAATVSKSFCESIAKALGSGEGSLAPVLDALGPELARLDRVDERVGQLAGRPGDIKRRVTAARVGDLVRSALRRGTGRDRAALIDQIRGLLAVLEGHGLGRALEPASWITWTAEALVDNEPPAPHKKSKKSASREAYLELRGEEQRTPITYTLAEVALLVGAGEGEGASAASVAKMLELLPEKVRSAVIALDVDRTDRALSYLERWWGDLEKGPAEACVSSGVFRLFWDDAALARITVETRLLEELLPSAAEKARSLRGRVEALAERVRAGGVTLLERRADEVWQKAIGSP